MAAIRNRGCGRGAAGREGYTVLSFQAENDSRRRRKPESDNENDPPVARSRKKKAAEPEVGDALRSAYQRVIREDIPPEMLDLLGKLG